MTEEKDPNVNLADESAAELESQFIMRLPPTPAAALRAAVRSGVLNLKERLQIQVEPDMRHGAVKFDKWALSGKIVDLPTIVESYKTLDCKNFYKTADVSRLMICKEEDEDASFKVDEDEPPKRKDMKDKRFLQLHGITPPLKNVKRRRFRKTLKKKNVDFPDVEKEVKRLFRMDNEAISVRYEVVDAEDEKNDSKTEDGDETIVSSGGINKTLNDSQSMDVAECDLFGEVLSSSDGENNPESELGDNSQMSIDLSKPGPSSKPLVEFSKGLLGHKHADSHDSGEGDVAISQLESKTAGENLGQILKEHRTEEEKSILLEKLDELEHEIADILARRRSQELEIMSIENQALKQRFQNVIDNLKQQEYEKQREYDDIVTILHQI